MTAEYRFERNLCIYIIAIVLEKKIGNMSMKTKKCISFLEIEKSQQRV